MDTQRLILFVIFAFSGLFYRALASRAAAAALKRGQTGQRLRVRCPVPYRLRVRPRQRAQ
jgi:hypothetical protein